MSIISNPSANVSALTPVLKIGASSYLERRGEAALEVRPIDEAYVGFVAEMTRKLEAENVQGAEGLAYMAARSLGFLSEDYKAMIAIAQNHPTTQAMHEAALSGRMQTPENLPDPALLNDPYPKADFSAYGLQTQMNPQPVESQDGMIARLEAFYNPIDRLLSEPDLIDRAYERYANEADGWTKRRGMEGVSREDIQREKQQQIQHLQTQHKLLSVALEVAKEYDFFTKREFVG